MKKHELLQRFLDLMAKRPHNWTRMDMTSLNQAVTDTIWSNEWPGESSSPSQAASEQPETTPTTVQSGQ